MTKEYRELGLAAESPGGTALRYSELLGTGLLFVFSLKGINIKPRSR